MFGDVAFRGAAVELLVVTMHSWALPCHTKSGFLQPSSMSCWLKLYHDSFDASAHHIAGGAAEFITFSRSHGIFHHFSETSDRSTGWFTVNTQNCVISKCLSQYAPNSRIHGIILTAITGRRG